MDNNGGVETGGRWGELGGWAGLGGKCRKLYLNNNKNNNNVTKNSAFLRLGGKWSPKGLGRCPTVADSINPKGQAQHVCDSKADPTFVWPLT